VYHEGSASRFYFFTGSAICPLLPAPVLAVIRNVRMQDSPGVCLLSAIVAGIERLGHKALRGAWVLLLIPSLEHNFGGAHVAGCRDPTFIEEKAPVIFEAFVTRSHGHGLEWFYTVIFLPHFDQVTHLCYA